MTIEEEFPYELILNSKYDDRFKFAVEQFGEVMVLCSEYARELHYSKLGKKYYRQRYIDLSWYRLNRRIVGRAGYRFRNLELMQMGLRIRFREEHQATLFYLKYR